MMEPVCAADVQPVSARASVRPWARRGSRVCLLLLCALGVSHDMDGDAQIGGQRRGEQPGKGLMEHLQGA